MKSVHVERGDLRTWAMGQLDAMERRPDGFGSIPEVVGRYETWLEALAFPDIERVRDAVHKATGPGPVALAYRGFTMEEVVLRLQRARVAVFEQEDSLSSESFE